MPKKSSDHQSQPPHSVPRTVRKAAAPRLKAGGAHKVKQEKQDSKYPHRWKENI
ncbi:MAG: hypothetical protein ACR2PV_08880 [Gammaproteobacteria bacterium]